MPTVVHRDDCRRSGQVVPNPKTGQSVRQNDKTSYLDAQRQKCSGSLHATVLLTYWMMMHRPVGGQLCNLQGADISSERRRQSTSDNVFSTEMTAGFSYIAQFQKEFD